MLVIKYTVFACIATIVNLLSQFITFEMISWADFHEELKKFSLPLAMLIGTGTGLVTKYFLDKKFIFYYKSNDAVDDIKTFTLYTVVGIFTTMIFWGMEFLFDYIINSASAKYIGAVIGLSIGYVCKYFLDKKYVFNSVIHENH